MRSPFPAFLRSIIATLIVIALATPAVAQGVDAAKLAELQRIIALQQKQIEAQSSALEGLRRQVDALARSARPMPAATVASGVAAAPAKAKPAAQLGAAAMTVSSGQKRVSLAISGQVNRGVLYADDGTNAEVFHVDNDNSSTRIRMVGTGKVNDDFSLGAQVEVQMESNSTASVSQTSDSGVGGTSFTERKLEVYLDSKRFGRLWLGQGDTASNGTSEVDLSGTSVVGYSAINDMTGGFNFYDKGAQAFGPSIGTVFSNLDGLSRDDRIRYDSPKFSGVQVATSHISGGAWDAALRYSAEIHGNRVAAAVGYADPSSINAGVDRRLSGSISILHPSGLNGTVAVASDSMEAGSGKDPSYYYGKLGYIWKYFSIGSTAFGLDFARADDVSQNGDKATSVGLFAVQNLEDYGTQFYLGARNHDLDRAGSNFGDVNSVLGGMRVKF